MKALAIFLISFLLTSCSYYTHYQTGIAPQGNTMPANVKIYSGDIDQEYEIIASVAVNTLGDGDNAAAFLKKKASKLGADAVIFAKLSKISSMSQRTGISGVAIKLKQ